MRLTIHDHRLGIGLMLIALCATALPSSAADPAARLAPPGGLACPRDQLTSYTGTVQAYRRTAQRTSLRIATDWQTTEAVMIRHPRAGSPSRWFLLEGQAFSEADWPRIEQTRGRLHLGLSVTAWVCDDGRNPIIDWRPPQRR